jgi:hypothetical protein
MTGEAPPLPRFDTIAAELRKLGVTLAPLLGEYRLNYRNGNETAVRTAETLDEAVELGRTMAAGAPAPAGPRRESAAAGHSA